MADSRAKAARRNFSVGGLRIILDQIGWDSNGGFEGGIPLSWGDRSEAEARGGRAPSGSAGALVQRDFECPPSPPAFAKATVGKPARLGIWLRDI